MDLQPSSALSRDPEVPSAVLPHSWCRGCVQDTWSHISCTQWNSPDSSAKLSAEVSWCHQPEKSKVHPGRNFYLLPEKADRQHPEQLQRQAKLECLCVIVKLVQPQPSLWLSLQCCYNSFTSNGPDRSGSAPRKPEKHKSSQSKSFQSFARGLAKRREKSTKKNLVSAKSYVLRGINVDTLVLIRLQGQHLTNIYGHQFGAPGSSTSAWTLSEQEESRS